MRKFLLTIFFAVAYWIVPLKAHEWYPWDCCSGIDCAPVLDVESVRVPTADQGLPIVLVRTKWGTAVVPPNFPVRPSRDNEMHACMTPASDGTMRLLCLFIPPSS
jgi:hypothetical protein